MQPIPQEQDRGFLISDNWFHATTREYSSANPIFAGHATHGPERNSKSHPSLNNSNKNTHKRG